MVGAVVAAGVAAGAWGLTGGGGAGHPQAAGAVASASAPGAGQVGSAAGGRATPALGTAAAGKSAAPSPAAAPQHSTAPTPVASIPPADPGRGMVYSGLTVAAKGDKCAGEFRTSQAGLCTHGPDAAPKGVDVHATVPVAVAATAPTPALQGGAQPPAAADLLKGALPALTPTAAAGGAGATVAQDSAPPTADPGGSAAVVCDGDGTSGDRVQVLYVHGPGQDRYSQYVASFKKWAADVDVIYDASAQQTGGDRHVRYVTDADCTANVLDVELPDAALAEFGATNDALAQRGFDRHDRKYMMFADANVYCGIGTFMGDERPGQDNLSNFGPSYGRSDSGCWSGHVAAHELGHNLGAVNNSAPYSSKAGHCTVDWDLMCYSDAPYYPQMQTLCPDQAQQDRLDCTKDDYFNTAPKAGSYLSTHWNVADNQFLIAGGPNPNPNPNPSPTASPSPSGGPSPSTGPSPTGGPSPTDSPQPTGGPTGSASPSPSGSSTGPQVQVGELTATSAVLSWPAVAGASEYQVQVGGQAVGSVRGTAVRLVQLRPDTGYQVAVAVRGADGKLSQPGPQASFHTPAVTGPVTAGTAYTLANGLTGQVADMWGGSSNNGDVLIGYQSTGYQNQQWTFEDAGQGLWRIKNVLSGKCLQIGGSAVAGQFVFQQPCAGNDAQAWQLGDGTGGAHVFKPKGSSLVLGLSNRWYYGGWLLELQQADGQPYQDWAIQSAS
jgi:hypothetical protein